MENPFRYGDVVRGAYFAGRSRERAELASDVRGGQNVVVISPRRYGKTSLVLETLGTLDQPRVLFAYADLLRAPTYERLPDLLANAVARIEAPLERALGRVGDLFRDLPLRPKFGVDPDGSISVEFTSGASRPDVDKTVERLLELPGRIAREREQRVVLVLDEFQAVVDLNPHLPATMRAIFQHQPEVAHVFLGSRHHLMQQMFEARNQPMYRMAKPLALGPIPRAEFAGFIRDRFASTKTPIGDEAVERVLDLTQGHPNDTQELCSFLWAIAYAAGTFPVSRWLVERALDRVLDAEHARYLTMWEQLRPNQKALLAAIAAEPAVGVYTAAFRHGHHLGDPSQIKRSLERLVQTGTVEPVAGPEAAYRVADTFLPAWLRRIGAMS